MPRDFLSDEPGAIVTDKPSGRDFLSESNQPEESLGAAAFMALPRIAEDVGRGVVEFAKKIPDYYQSAKKEVPGIAGLFREHPGRAGSQLLAGLTEAGHNSLNVPQSIAQYAEGRLNLLPKGYAEKVPHQQDISSEINQAFGKPQYPGEELFRGVGRNAADLLGVAKAGSVLNPMNLTAGSIAKDIVKTGEKNKSNYSKMYTDLWNQAGKKNFDDLSSVVPLLDMETLKKYTPKKKIAYLEDFNKQPSLERAHNAKSDLLKVARKLEEKVTLNGAERKQYKAVSNAIGDLEENMFKNKIGVPDMAMKDKYRKLQTGYAKDVVPYMNKYISQYKRKDISSKELLNALSKGAFREKKGSSHLALGVREKMTPALALLGAGGLGKYLLDRLTAGQEQ